MGAKVQVFAGAVGGRLGRDQRAIGEDGGIGGGGDVPGEAGLEERLVEAGDDGAGAGGLALGAEQLVGAVLGAEQALQPVADLAGEGEVERGRPGGQRLREADDGDLAVGVRCDGAGQITAVCCEPCGGEIERAGVRLDGIGRGGEIERDNDAAVELVAVGADVEGDVVVAWQHAGGEPIRFRVHPFSSLVVAHGRGIVDEYERACRAGADKRTTPGRPPGMALPAVARG